MTINNVIAIDTETTGKEPLVDRLVTVFAGTLDRSGKWSNVISDIFDMGVHIPDEAASVHGITNEIREEKGLKGSTSQYRLEQLHALISVAIINETPITIYNATFDTTLLNREFVYAGLDPIDWEKAFLIDPFVFDKHFDKYRKGSRTLTSTAPVYGVEVDVSKAHDASYDCYITGSIVLSKKFGEYLKGFTQEKVIRSQKGWKLDQQKSFESYLRKANSDPKITLPKEWPELKSVS